MGVMMSAIETGKGLTYEERHAARETAKLLVDGFDWRSTPQGDLYWAAVHRALLELAFECREAGE